MCTSCADAAPAPGASRRAVLGGLAGLGGLTALGLHGAPSARAAAGARGGTPSAALVARPSIIPCSTWGAQPARSSISMVGPPQKILVHHMASANTTDYSLAAAYRIARDCQSWHFARGWGDTGQQFSVSRGGYILEGRHRSVEGLGSGSSRVFPLGAHCTGQNSTSLGIENEGTYTGSTPPAAQWSALVRLCAYLCQTYALSPSVIYGHRDFLDTACPGDAFYAKLPQLRRDVAAALAVSPPPPPPPTRSWPTVQYGNTGFRVTAAQYLLRHSGRSLGIDGSFGPGTLSAAKAFQSAKGLTADGVIGRLTWESPLATTCREGQSSDAVRGLQTCLRAKGHSVTVDGSFGPATRSAVVAFQTSQTLDPDAVVGPNTWSRLLA